MKAYHKNPRRISDSDLADLRRWLEELGDLSGIVHDLNSDEIIGGNQRGRVFDINHATIELVEGPHEPDEQGTVAHGFVVWQGKRYAYRQVRWTERQCEKANIVANQAGGDWDAVILASEFETADLLEWGFEEGELEELLKAAGIEPDGAAVGEPGDAEPDLERAEELAAEWGVQPGQVWRLPSRVEGQFHLLACGDSTDAAVVQQLMAGERAALFATDPPYLVDYDGMNHPQSWKASPRKSKSCAVAQKAAAVVADVLGDLLEAVVNLLFVFVVGLAGRAFDLNLVHFVTSVWYIISLGRCGCVSSLQSRYDGHVTRWGDEVKAQFDVLSMSFQCP